MFLTLVEGNELDLGNTLEIHIDNIIYHTGIFSGILWVALTSGSKDAILKGGAIVYAGSFLQNVFNVIINDYIEFDAGTVFGPLYTVLFFAGIVMVIRLYHGKTLLPWVDVRI